MVGEERIELSLLAKHDFEYNASFDTVLLLTLLIIKILCKSCVRVKRILLLFTKSNN